MKVLVVILFCVMSQLAQADGSIEGFWLKDDENKVLRITENLTLSVCRFSKQRNDILVCLDAETPEVLERTGDYNFKTDKQAFGWALRMVGYFASYVIDSENTDALTVWENLKRFDYHRFNMSNVYVIDIESALLNKHYL